MRSAPARGDRRRGLAHHVGVGTEELDRDRVARRGGCAASRVDVRRLRWATAKLETISETASPAPWRRACRRTNQLPIPASGASTTRLGDVADRNGDVRGRSERRRIARTAVAAWRRRSAAIRVRSQINRSPVERQQVVDLVDRLAERDDRVAGRRWRSTRRRSPELASIRRGDRRRPRRRSRRRRPTGSRSRSTCRSPASGSPSSIRGQLARARSASASIEISMPGAITPPRYSPSAETASKVIAGAEVDDDAGVAEPVVGGDGVDQPVGADLVRVVDQDRHAGLAPRADDQAGRAQVAAAPSPRTRAPAAAPPRRRSRRRPRRAPTPRAPGGRRSAPRARRPSASASVRSASARRARRRRRRRGASACCRRRWRGASAIIGSATRDGRRRQALRDPGSHPSRARDDDARAKGIPYKRVDLMPVVSKGALRAVGFPGITVPALKIDGRKVQGSREIARELDRIEPEPPLLPADPTARGGRGGRDLGRRGAPGRCPPDPVERAAARPRPLVSYSEGARLGGPGRARREDRAPLVALRPGSTRPPTRTSAPTSPRSRAAPADR